MKNAPVDKPFPWAYILTIIVAVVPPFVMLIGYLFELHTVMVIGMVMASLVCLDTIRIFVNYVKMALRFQQAVDENLQFLSQQIMEDIESLEKRH